MSTEEHETLDGEVHGLLAGAFDDGVPMVNLVPGVVDGYRRHRRRSRVLGTAGALAVAGVVAAGTVLPGSGTSGGTTAVSAAHGSGDADQAAGKAGALEKDPLCDGLYHSFSGRPGDHVYTADNATLERVCASDLAHLRTAIPGTQISPVRETYQQALAVHDIPPGTPAPVGTPENTQWITPGEYLVAAAGRKTYIDLTVSDRQGWGFNGCSAIDCPPNLRLADGTPATETPASSAKVGVGTLSIHLDTTHWVLFSASANAATKDEEALSFDFAKAVRTKAFADAVAHDVRSLTKLG
jgi:hypothetical protein